MTTQGNSEGSSGESRSQGGAQAILTVLRSRGIDVPEGARQHIQNQQDAAILERWLERAVVATTIEDVVDDPN